MSVNTGQVRLLIGDTDSSNQLLSDLQIQILADLYTDVYSTAAAACRALAAKFARLVDASVDSVDVKNSQKYKHYNELAATLEQHAKTSGRLAGIPMAGGMSLADRLTQQADTDRIQPVFTRDLFNEPD